MPKKTASRKSSPKKKKSWWTFLFFFAIAGVIAIPVAAKMTFPEDQLGEVAGISSVASNSGEFRDDKKPCPTITSTTAGVSPKPCRLDEKKPKPPIYVYSETLSRESCFPGFQSISFKCTNGYTGTFSESTCVEPEKLLRKAESECMKLITPTITPKQKINSTQGKFLPKVTTTSAQR